MRQSLKIQDVSSPIVSPCFSVQDEQRPTVEARKAEGDPAHCLKPGQKSVVNPIVCACSSSSSITPHFISMR